MAALPILWVVQAAVRVSGRALNNLDVLAPNIVSPVSRRREDGSVVPYIHFEICYRRGTVVAYVSLVCRQMITFFHFLHVHILSFQAIVRKIPSQVNSVPVYVSPNYFAIMDEDPSKASKASLTDD